ncbi:MAG TPA: formyltetrahydrofolate deformylase [Nocardioidaceae bacterium]|nr:formyltetrahydrofolate deformylase [Nocardioidaceae bacterium]
MKPESTVGLYPEYVLTIACPDRPGIVFAVSSFLVQHTGNILESQQFDDRLQDRFFMRVHFEVYDAADTLDNLRKAFTGLAEAYSMTWRMWPEQAKYRTLVLVSKFGHCLNDLLYRQSIGALQIEIPAVVSNHTDLEPLANSFGVPFHHIPVPAGGKSAAEAELLALVESLQVHLVVLARYMQVLSDQTCHSLEGRAINIHHSFLPSFKGAGPYQQAFDRGVKLVGATAHYVTPELDEGPIIEQDVLRVDHSLSAQALMTAGRDVESQVLSRAVRWHAESRVLLNDRRTVVLR